MKIEYLDGTTKQVKEITNYTLEGNVLTVDFGSGSNFVTKAGDQLNITVGGMLKEIKEYKSDIKLQGKLTDYRGENTSIDLGEVTKTQKAFTAQYQMPQANIKIVKRDSVTEEKLSNSTFTLYEWNGNEYVEKEKLTDGNQDGIYESKYYEWNTTTQGRYKIVETGIPENHKDLGFSFAFTINQLKTSNYTITPDYDNGEYTIKYEQRIPDDLDRENGVIENEPYKVNASIEVVDSQTKKQIVEDAEFTVYEWNKETGKYEEYISYTTGQPVKMKRQLDGTYLSQQWLYYSVKNEGKYRIIETKAPKGYYGDYKDDQTKEKKTYDINILNVVKEGKYNGQVAGNESILAITNQENKFENIRITNKIEVDKIDSQSKTNIPQGDASIEGTIYEIYAKEDIHHADGITTNYQGKEALIYQKDELIDTQTINKDGKLSFENLECGIYYIKEKEAGKGYLVDENTYDVDLKYRDEVNAQITEKRTLEETVMKQGFQITKLKQKEGTEYEGLEKAGFSIYQISELSIVKTKKVERVSKDRYKLLDPSAKNSSFITSKVQKDGTYKLMDLIDYYYKMDYKEGYEEELPGDQYVYHPYHMEEEALVKNYQSNQEGSTIGEMITGKSGTVASPELAYGEYIVLETSVPRNYDTARPFVVAVENDSRTLQSLRYIADADFEARVKIYKVDSQTKQNVIGKSAKYVIRNLDTGELVTKRRWIPLEGYVEEGSYEHPYETGTEGYLITEVALGAGNYEIEEVGAPQGYTLNGYEGSSNQGQTNWNKKGRIQFEIFGNTAHHVDEYLGESVIVQKQENKAQVGSIKIESKGEYLKQVTTNQDGKAEVKYEVSGIQGSKYEVIAKETIVSQDGQTTLHQKGEVVRTVVTNDQGIGYAENLPLGSYTIKQITAGEGFALNQEERTIDVTYKSNEENGKAQETPVVYYESIYENQRQKLEIELEKIDQETKQKLAGAIFGIYVRVDITGKDGKVILAKDTLVEKHTTNEEGKIEFNKELPLGSYYIKEEQAPTGYAHKEEIMEIEGRYQGDQKQAIILEKEYTNEKTKVYVQKTDENGEGLAGATLQIQDQSGKVVKEWETTKGNYQVQGLQTNKQYKVVETNPATGYVTAGEINFKIQADGNVENKKDNTIVMKDETTKVQIEVVDKQNKGLVEGVKYEIYQGDKKVLELTSQKTGNLITKLPIGNYTLKEIVGQKEILDKGYITADPQEFKVEDTKETQKVTVEQDVTKLQVSVLDEESKQPVAGIKFEIYQATKQEDGKLVIGAKVRDVTSKEEGYYTERLGVGGYILRQVKEQEAAQGKGYITIDDHYFAIEDKKEIQKVELEQKVSKLEISIVDKETKKPVEGVKYEIYQGDKKVLELTSQKEANLITKLPMGTYTLRQPKDQKEILLDKGYATLEDQTFTVGDTKETQKVTVEQEYIKLEVSVVDESTKNPIEGMKFEIYQATKQKDGSVKIGQKVRDFTSKQDAYHTERLGVGGYILRQVKEQGQIQDKGYLSMDDHYFTIEDKKEIQRVELEQKVSKVEISIIDKENKNSVEGVKYEIYQGDKKVLELTSQKEGNLITKLPMGTYTLRQPKEQRESLLNKGYVTIEDQTFVVKDTKEVQKVTVEQDYTKLQVSVLEENTKNPIEGMKFEIYQAMKQVDGSLQIGEKVRDFTSKQDAYYTERLGVGGYILRQVKEQDEIQDKGYLSMEDRYFTIEDIKEVQKVGIEQQVSKVEVEVVDKENKEKILGAKLQIIKQTEEKEEIVREFVTGENNYATEKLPMGTYILRQPKDQKESLLDKGYVTIDDQTFKVEDTKEVQKVTVEQDYTKLEVSVFEESTQNSIEGMKFEVYQASKQQDGKLVIGEKVRDFTSKQDDYYTERLGVGGYILRQVKGQDQVQDKGYLSMDDHYFTIEDTKEIQRVDLKQQVSKVEISIVDKETKKPVEGVKYEIYQGDKKILELTSQKEANQVKKLPMGTYTLRQPKGQKEILLDKGYATIEDQTFKVEDAKDVQKVTVEQDYTKLEASVVDETTKNPIEGMKFEIYQASKQEDGKLVIGEKVRDFTSKQEKYYTERLGVGGYILRQVKEQDQIQDKGYLSMEDRYFTIEDTKEIQKLEIEQQVSKIEIEVIDKENKGKILGAKVQIIKQTEEKEEIVREFVTGENNYATEKLPMGTYILRQPKDQKEALLDKGYATIEDQTFKVEDTKEIQKTIVEQDYTKLEVSVLDETTKNPIEGMKFEIYQASKQEDGKLVIGEKVRDFTSKQDAYYTERLGVGGYILRQVKGQDQIQNKGYLSMDDHYFTIEDTKEIQKLEIEQQVSKVEISIVDKETKEPIEGIKYEIYQGDRKIVEIISKKGANLVKKLPMGTYTLRQPKGQKEILLDKGYATIEDQTFIVKDTKDVQKVTVEQDYTKLEVSVVDETTKNPIEGMKFEIYQATKQEDGSLQAGEKVRDFTSKEDAYYTERLGVGGYILRQVKEQDQIQDKGYLSMEDHYFTIEDTKEIQKLEIEQQVSKVEISMIDKETKELIEGIKYEIYQGDNKVVEITSKKVANLIKKLPMGTYTLRQPKDQKEILLDKGYATIEDQTFIVKDTKDVQKVTVEQDYTKLEVSVVEESTKNPIEGMKFEIYQASKQEDGSLQVGEKVRDFTSKQDAYYTQRLGVGGYILRQVKEQDQIQDKGYLSVEDHYFKVEDTKEVQKVQLEQQVSKVEIELLDKQTKEKILGVQVQIIKQTKANEGTKQEETQEEIVREFVTGENNYTTQKLPMGTYILRQPKDQKESLLNKGYVTIDDQEFKVEDINEVQKTIVEQDVTKLEVSVLEEERKELIEGMKFEIYQVIKKEEDGQEKLFIGERVREFVSKQQAYYTERLGVGGYILRQVKEQDQIQDKGYLSMKDHYFTIEDTKEIQKLEAEQKVSKIEIGVVDKETKEPVEGVKYEIYQGDTKILELTSQKEANLITKLPMGTYVLTEVADQTVLLNKGYVTTDPQEFKVEDTKEIQKVMVEQDYTKLDIEVVDQQSKEPVIGATLVITDLEGKAVGEAWISNGKQTKIQRLPVGEYYLEEKEAPTLKGYVKTEKVKIKVEETKEIQKVEFEQDYTQTTIKIMDPITKEELKEAELILKDEKGKEVTKFSIQEQEQEQPKDPTKENVEEQTKEVEKQEETIGNILEKLPVGKYWVESSSMQYGYKPLKAKIEIQDKQGLQEKVIESDREEFDLKVEEWVKQIVRNGQTEYNNEKEEQKVKKIDIKDKKINTEDVRITYKIKVSNPGKITGQVGRIEVNIPSGMTYKQEDNKGYWRQENGKVITEGLKGRDLKETDYAEIELVLRWKNGLEHFGTKQVEVEIKDTMSDIEFDETNFENNKAISAEVIIGVTTGQMNLVYGAWTLLILLILIEVYISRKLKIKGFKIKDRTLKYKK